MVSFSLTVSATAQDLHSARQLLLGLVGGRRLAGFVAAGGAPSFAAGEGWGTETAR